MKPFLPKALRDAKPDPSEVRHPENIGSAVAKGRAKSKFVPSTASFSFPEEAEEIEVVVYGTSKSGRKVSRTKKVVRHRKRVGIKYPFNLIDNKTGRYENALEYCWVYSDKVAVHMATSWEENEAGVFSPSKDYNKYREIVWGVSVPVEDERDTYELSKVFKSEDEATAYAVSLL